MTENEQIIRLLEQLNQKLDTANNYLKQIASQTFGY